MARDGAKIVPPDSSEGSNLNEETDQDRRYRSKSDKRSPTIVVDNLAGHLQHPEAKLDSNKSICLAFYL